MVLGYFVSQLKSTLLPVQRMVHLGLGIDSSLMAFFLPDRLRQKFRGRREELLSTGLATEKQMQSFIGKCNHLKSVFPASSLFTFHCRRFVSQLDENPSPLPHEVMEEVRFWSCIDSMTDPIPFRRHQHLRLSLFTDASGYGWGAYVSLPSGPLVLRDYWQSDLLSNDICVKEALAVLFVLQALPESVWSRRVDICVDNEGLSLAWSGLRASSQGLAEVLKELALLCIDLNVDLRLLWVPTDFNIADAPSRVLCRSDARLSDALRLSLWERYGPFSWDLMALPSNAFSVYGRSLPFFSPFPIAGCAGVDVFSQRAPRGVSYAFPPFVMILPLIGLLEEWGDVCAILVLPFDSFSAPPSWFSRLSPFILEIMPLVSKTDIGSVLFPSSGGFAPNCYPLAFGLSAFKCFFPPRAPLPRPFPPPPFRILIGSDSMLRPLAALKWPSPFNVEVVCLSGASLATVISQLVLRLPAQFDACLFHAGVNDVSRGGDDFQGSFQSSCSYAASVLSSKFPEGAILCSSVCQTKSASLNERVRVANEAFRSFSASYSWRYVSHDNIRFADLSDEVHLSASGVAKMYRHLCFAFRSLLSS